jgi:glyoxylase-like metal-dependent hydrolase (beta-lactamase superfamily II)
MSDYSIWVLEYAYVPKYHMSGIIYGAHNEGYRKLPYGYVVIKGKDRVAMVDVGFNNKDLGATFASMYGVENWHSPREVLAQCGVTPEQVTDIFVTHAHFDHIGGTGEFPNAKFYIQEQELSKWIWAMSLGRKFSFLTGAIDPADIMRMVNAAKEGRLVVVDGDREDVLPGIDVHAALDSHTWGCMYVRVRNDGKPDSADSFVFAGDLAYCMENLRGRDGNEGMYIPVGLAVGSQMNLLTATDRMLGMVGNDVKRVIPVHEERLKDLYPSRLNKDGLQVIEICLANGERSLVH